jgi:hypothetical protein
MRPGREAECARLANSSHRPGPGAGGHPGLSSANLTRAMARTTWLPGNGAQRRDLYGAREGQAQGNGNRDTRRQDAVPGQPGRAQHLIGPAAATGTGKITSTGRGRMHGNLTGLHWVWRFAKCAHRNPPGAYQVLRYRENEPRT